MRTDCAAFECKFVILTPRAVKINTLNFHWRQKHQNTQDI